MPKTFTQAVQEWWQKFDEMKVGQAYEIAKCSKNVELFTDVCKDYIDHSELGYQYDLTPDYRFFRRRFSDVLESKQKSPA